MKKRGFTLTELLAVIVILSVIALITIPIILNVMKSVRKSTFKSSAYGIVESAKIYYSKQTKNYDFDGIEFNVTNGTIKELDIEGKKLKSGTVEIKESGEIEVYVTDGEFCAYKGFNTNEILITEETSAGCSGELEVPDIKPVGVKINSDTVAIKTECELPENAKAKIIKYEFSKDGGETWKSKIENGTYLNYYTFSGLKQKDENGQEINYTFKTRCITDIGTQALRELEISLTEIAQPIITVPTGWAKEKEITISLPKGRYKYEIREIHGSNDSGYKEIDSTDWKKGGTASTTKNVYKKTITKNNTQIIVKVSDETGNYVDGTSSAITGIDNKAPSCGNWTGNSTWKNTAVTVKVACTDQAADADNDISGCTATTYNVKTYNTDNTTVEKAAANTLTVTISDKAGNTKECKNTGAVDVYYDKEAPTCVWSGESTTWRKSGTVTVTCNNNGSGSNCNSSYNSKSWTYTSGTATTKTASLSYEIRDTAGNSTTCSKTANVYVDRTPPTCTSGGGDATWTNSSRELVGTCSDTGGSGCLGNAYWLINWQGSWSNLSPGTISDNVGNTTKCPATQPVRIDKTAPTIGTATYTNLAQSSYTMTISGSSDSGGSGVNTNSYTYSVSGGNTGSGSNVFTPTAVNTITVTLKDNAGNTSTKYFRINAFESYLTQLYYVLRDGGVPDDEGYNNWLNTYYNNNNVTIKNIIRGFYNSAEITNKNLSNEEYVKAMYRGILGREADSTGLTSYVNNLNSGISRSQKVEDMMNSTEFQNLATFYDFKTVASYSPSTYAASVSYSCPSGKRLNGSNCDTVETYGCTTTCTKEVCNATACTSRSTTECTTWQGSNSWQEKNISNERCTNSSYASGSLRSAVTMDSSDGRLHRTIVASRQKLSSPSSSKPYGTCTITYAEQYCPYDYRVCISTGCTSSTTVSYECDSTCENVVSTTPATPNYSCKSGDIRIDTTCYTCPSGGTFNSSTRQCNMN